eukprot:NODE_1548_length_817_cov_76.923188_g1500_i0.p1 GENE.NODE_1548_length_817_cov_76.923188_g1500_i0~~NODE_1548_length_817_cov_76.923188_g1500_i0.p1  ORF type:complete len:256 (-),score=63.45 NODE_1548_length_817_cov_76.923188_g1500_i0:50-727(-)
MFRAAFTRLSTQRFAGATRTYATASAGATARTGLLTAASSCLVGAGLFAMYQNATATSIETAAKANAGKLGTDSERSFIMIKPDGVQRGLIGEVINRFERRGFKLVAMKMMTPSKQHAAKHYDDLKSKPFFPGLVDYMSCGVPVIAMVWEGKGVIKTGRKILGATNPLDSEPGTLRGDYFISIGRNGIHGSDSFESANDEIGLWFKDHEINEWSQTNAEWITSAN